MEGKKDHSVAYRVTVNGLTGGHSGTEIHKGNVNANKLMGRFLYDLEKDLMYRISSVCGGEKDNAIPSSCEVELIFDADEEEKFLTMLSDLSSVYQEEFRSSDSGMKWEALKLKEAPKKALRMTDKEKVIFLLVNLPNGVQRMSREIDGLVETSLNLGRVFMEEGCVTFILSVRSSVKSAKAEIIDRIRYMIEFMGGEAEISGDYPAWEYKKRCV